MSHSGDLVTVPADGDAVVVRVTDGIDADSAPGGSVTGFAAAMEDGFVCLTVGDGGGARPVRSAAGHNRPGGYGWPPVCAVAEDVEVAPRPGGGKSA